MAELKSVIFSNETPNDQGSIILNSSFDFSRFSKNPIMLCNHEWEEVIGHWENVRFENGNWVADPVFSASEDGQEHALLFAEGNMKSASIGASIIWRTDKMGNQIRNEQGHRIAEKTLLYEISLVAIPSNPDAVALNSVKEYSEDYQTLNSKKRKKMNEQEKDIVEEITKDNSKPAHKEPDIEPDGDKDDKVPQTEKKQKMKTVILQGFQQLSDSLKMFFDEYTSKVKPVEEIKPENETQLKSEINIVTPKIEAQKMELKTKAELQEDGVKLAANPSRQAVVIGSTNTLTQLRGDAEGRKIIARLQGRGGQLKDTSDHVAFIEAMSNDPKYQAIDAKLNVIASGNGNDQRFDFKRLISEAQLTKLTSSDDALTTPATAAIEWLSIVIDALFPTNTWKSRIPVFPAMITESNLGIIWANNAADPTIYKGSKPSNPADYEYTDTAVSLKMNNYWLQPMLWTPLTMAYLRYDQMAAGWRQAMNKLNATIDTDLIYTLAAVVPAASVLKTSGTGFSIASSTDVDAFVLNTAFTGTLAKPTLSDILKFQQLFEKQNFDLSGWYIDAVLDPTMKKYILDDDKAKSKLTRFVGEANDEISAYSHTGFFERSKVALYNPATGLVVDPTGVIPAGAVSAALIFIPEQVAIGLGKFDVFAVVKPGSYGYQMSADIRSGIAPMRANYNGLGLFTYGDPQV